MSDEVKYGLAGVLADDTAVSKVMPEINSLTYRGYKVQDLAAECRFEEVAYLIWNGELPDAGQLDTFNRMEKKERGLSSALLDVMGKFNKRAHPMDTLRTAVSFLGQEDGTTGRFLAGRPVRQVDPDVRQDPANRGGGFPSAERQGSNSA